MLELIEQIWFIYDALFINSGAHNPTTGWHRWLTK
jgi:hypothetical protein